MGYICNVLNCEMPEVIASSGGISVIQNKVTVTNNKEIALKEHACK